MRQISALCSLRVSRGGRGTGTAVPGKSVSRDLCHNQGQTGTDGASIKFNQSPSRVPTFDFQVPVPVPSPHFSILSPRPCPQSPLLNFVSPTLSPSPRLCPHPCSRPQIFKFSVSVPVPGGGSRGSQSPMPTSDLAYERSFWVRILNSAKAKQTLRRRHLSVNNR